MQHRRSLSRRFKPSKSAGQFVFQLLIAKKFCIYAKNFDTYVSKFLTNDSYVDFIFLHFVHKSLSRNTD